MGRYSCLVSMSRSSGLHSSKVHVGAKDQVTGSLNQMPMCWHSSGMIQTFTGVSHAGRTRHIFAAVAMLLLCAWSARSRAEPYIAVQQGLACGQCHVNPTGGGMRTVVGNAFAQGVLPANHVDTGDLVWTGEINKFIALGADFRAAATWNNSTAANDAFNTEQARVYLGISPIPGRVLLYIDEQVAPDAAVNREAWAMYRFGDDRWYLRAGHMYLAYGLRLQDQQAFIRQIAGINMDTPDNGMELGYRSGLWEAQFAISNGASGGAESNNGKQYTLQIVRIKDTWRIGVGGNYNDDSAQRSSAPHCLVACVPGRSPGWRRSMRSMRSQPGRCSSNWRPRYWKPIG